MKRLLSGTLFPLILILVAELIFSSNLYAAAHNLPPHNASSNIVIDPGHSPKSKGAKSCTGAYEYIYNDYIVSLLERHLKYKNINIIKSREHNEEKSLAERAKLAKNKKLFLSIHHDSVHPRYIKSINGNPSSTHGSGYSIFVSKKNKNYAQSLKYATFLGKELRKSGLKPSHHHAENISGENRKLINPDLGIYEFDDLIVLKNSEAPALLLEVGVIVNPKDEAECLTPEFQNKIINAIDGLITYATSSS